MKRANYCLLVLPLLFGSGSLQAALSWSAQMPQKDAPARTGDHGGGHQHGGGRGGGKPFLLHDAVGAEAEVWLPTLVRRPLEVNGAGVVKLAGTGLDNYHLLYARRQTEMRDELALRYQSLRGKPSGESPRLLIAYRKGTLDITPDPAPREHRRYYSSSEAVFVLRFKNRPLAMQPVQLQTSNATQLELTTDIDGVLKVTLPEDFSDIKMDERGNKPAEFTLSTSYTENGKVYLTTLNADYHVSPSHWQSKLGGGLSILIGFVGGLLVLRRARRQEGGDA